MSSTSDNISKKIQQLFIAIGSMPIEDDANVETSDYDWSQPTAFNSNQQNLFDNFTEKLGLNIAGKFSELYNTDFHATIDSTTLHFAKKFFDQILENKQNDYYLPFGTNPETPCAFVGISIKSAMIWTTQLLGDTAVIDDNERNLSVLEESLLMDVATGIVEAFSNSVNIKQFMPIGSLIRRQLPLEISNAEEFCKITFKLNKADSENPDDAVETYLVIIRDQIETIAGINLQNAEEISPESISKAIFNQVQKMTVPVTVHLDKTFLTVREIMDIEAGDILMLDKKVDDTVEVLINNKTIFHGKPAKSTGKYAVVITKLHDAEQNLIQFNNIQN